jgi:hypothetical protein
LFGGGIAVILFIVSRYDLRDRRFELPEGYIKTLPVVVLAVLLLLAAVYAGWLPGLFTGFMSVAGFFILIVAVAYVMLVKSGAVGFLRGFLQR